MNQRILELEKQCWSHRVDGTLVDGQLHFDTKKFAELIVDECLQIINNPVNYNKVVYTTYDKDQANGVARALSDKIKEHFKDTQ